MKIYILKEQNTERIVDLFESEDYAQIMKAKLSTEGKSFYIDERSLTAGNVSVWTDDNITVRDEDHNTIAVAEVITEARRESQPVWADSNGNTQWEEYTWYDLDDVLIFNTPIQAMGLSEDLEREIMHQAENEVETKNQ